MLESDRSASSSRGRSLMLRLGLVVALLAVPAVASAQDAPAAAPPPAGKSIGGHVGVAVPLLMVDHPTKNIGDQLNIAHPIGIGFKLQNGLIVDFEIVVANHINQNKAPATLTIDPGIVYNWGAFATGLRVKWDVGAPPNIGIIPLINRGIVDFGGATWFIEAAFPTTIVNSNLNFDVVLHSGLAF